MIKTKKKSEPQKVTISRVTRNKRKYVTVIKGLQSHGKSHKIKPYFIFDMFVYMFVYHQSSYLSTLTGAVWKIVRTVNGISLE